MSGSIIAAVILMAWFPKSTMQQKKTANISERIGHAKKEKKFPFLFCQKQIELALLVADFCSKETSEAVLQGGAVILRAGQSNLSNVAERPLVPRRLSLVLKLSALKLGACSRNPQW